jgi:hypothetical protein
VINIWLAYNNIKMASSTDSSTELRDAAYLLEVFAAMPEFKTDWNSLALKHGVHIGTAYTSALRMHTTRSDLHRSLTPFSSRRFKAIAKRYGYKFENGKVTQDGEDAVAGGQSTQTPKKAKAKRAPKGNPTPKKRKLSEATVKDEEDLVGAQNNLKAAEARNDTLVDVEKRGSGEDADEEDEHSN